MCKSSSSMTTKISGSEAYLVSQQEVRKDKAQLEVAKLWEFRVKQSQFSTQVKEEIQYGKRYNKKQKMLWMVNNEQFNYQKRMMTVTFFIFDQLCLLIQGVRQANFQIQKFITEGKLIVVILLTKNQIRLENMEIMILPLTLSKELTVIQCQYSQELHQEESIFDKYKVGLVHSNAPFKLFQTNCSTSGDDDSDDQSKSDRRTRGPYRKYTFQQKMQAVDRIVSGEDVKIISKQFGIPRRNLLRWKKNGCQRKQGGGRPTDAQMERSIYQKIMCKQLQTQKEIRKYAIQLSKTCSFKASKGWFVKFCNRFGIILRNPNGSQAKLESQFENENNENCQSVQLKLQI